jgi:tetratricopeptide (TPR) repeat protein
MSGLSSRLQGEIMVLFGVIRRGRGPGICLRVIIVFAGVALGWSGSGSWAKEPSLTAIELYDGAGGAAYIQIADVLINGKAELRSCVSSESASIDKSAYNKLQKVGLAAGGVLERGADGLLRYGSGDGQSGCVVPDGIKFEHNGSFTPVEMADSADLRGRPIANGSDGSATAPQIKKGTKLVFVAAPNVEQAEYMLAQRVSTEKGWQNYLSAYPASPHTEEAKRVLAGMYVQAGENALSAYLKSTSSSSPAYSDLKIARAEVNQAHQVLPNSDREIKLAEAIRGSLAMLADKGKAELDAYKTALASASPGYVHLQTAKGLADAIADVDGTFAPGATLKADVAKASDTFEMAVRTGQAALDGKQYEEAVKAVQPYRQFAPEEPRVARIIDGAYAAYLQQGQQFEDAKDWQNAIKSFQSALQAKDTPEARDSLKSAQKEFGAVQDAAAANAALEKSKTYELQKDLIPAYEVLTSLPEGQRAIVKSEIDRLAPAYVQAASQRAKDIAKAYPAVQGIGDEKAVESAYVYLQRASELTEDEATKQAFQTRMQNLGDELSVWFLDRAKHSLARPMGAGTELGWAYLKEAEAYKSANLEAVRDQMKMADPAHEMHSKLSIRVQFRDQTSQRQSEGFAGQMESAIAAALDTSGMALKVVRSGDTLRQDVDPDFLIAGDVLEHHIAAPPTVESVDSTYIAGVHEIPSDDWNKANRVYESALNELHTAQASLQGAQVKGKKKEVEDANNQVAAAQKKVDDARVNLDSFAKSKTEDIIRPYTYKKTTYDVTNRVVLQFRIDDQFSGQKGEPVQVAKQEKKQFVTLTDVKAEDSKGIKSEGTLPDLIELQTQLDNVAREELTNKVHEKIVALPQAIYDAARKKETDGYPEDAGEAYMRYLNVAPADQINERDHAQKFLRDQFNFQTFPGEIRSNPHPAPALEQGMAQPAQPAH